MGLPYHQKMYGCLKKLVLRENAMLKKTLMILGAPRWVPILLSAVAVLVSLYVALWSVIVSLWAVFASLVGCGIGGVVGGIIVVVTGNTMPGIALIGMALICAGLSIFCFFGCKKVTDGCVQLSKKVILRIKKSFRKETI